MVAAWSWLLAEFLYSGLKACFLSGSSRLCVLDIFVINENTSRSKFLNFESSKVSVRREPSCSMWYSLSCLSFILGAVWNRCSGDWWRWNAGSLTGENSLSVSLRFVTRKNKNPTMNLCGYYHICHRLCVKVRIQILVTLWQLLIPLPIYLLFLIYFTLYVFLYYAWAVFHNIANLMVFPTKFGYVGYSYVFLSSG